MKNRISNAHFDRAFAFDKRSERPDGLGNTRAEWVEQFIVSAGLHDLRGGETVMAARLEGKQPAIVTIRRSAQTKQITTDWRARDVRSGDIYNIRTKTLTKNRAYFEMLCEKGVAHG